MPWPKTGATQYHAQLGIPDEGRAIKRLVVCNSWDLDPWDLINGLALGCYQPSPEVLIVFLFLWLLSTLLIIIYFIYEFRYVGKKIKNHCTCAQHLSENLFENELRLFTSEDILSLAYAVFFIIITK